jgi:hypothetical protein
MSTLSPDTGSILKVSASRWSTRQAIKLRAAYRSQQFLSQVMVTVFVDLVLIWLVPAPALYILLAGIQVAFLAIAHGDSKLVKTTQEKLSDEITQRRRAEDIAAYEAERSRELEFRNEELTGQLSQLRTHCDEVARAADAVFLSSRFLPTGRREAPRG